MKRKHKHFNKHSVILIAEIAFAVLLVLFTANLDAGSSFYYT